jgi:DNA-binding transcriptional ArsR family regulator
LAAEAAMRSVVVGAAASELRRAVGPTSWMVLEEMLMRSTGRAGACVSSVSVRALAASLGLAKDTAGRAIRRLRDAGLVTVAQQRTVAGVFDTGTYVIALPDGVTLIHTAPATSQPRARVGRRDFSQLSLAIES